MINENIKFREIIVLACAIAIGAMLVPAFSKCVELKSYNDSTGTTVGQSTSTAVENRMIVYTGGDGKANHNGFTSGRLSIWKYCMDNSSILGNEIKSGIVLEKDAGKVRFINDYVHNTVIELLHRSGMSAGIFFLILELVCAV